MPCVKSFKPQHSWRARGQLHGVSSRCGFWKSNSVIRPVQQALYMHGASNLAVALLLCSLTHLSVCSKATAQLWKLESNSFYHVHLRNQTQVTKLGSKCSSSLIHLTVFLFNSLILSDLVNSNLESENRLPITKF